MQAITANTGGDDPGSIARTERVSDAPNNTITRQRVRRDDSRVVNADDEGPVATTVVVAPTTVPSGTPTTTPGAAPGAAPAPVVPGTPGAPTTPAAPGTPGTPGTPTPPLPRTE